MPIGPPSPQRLRRICDARPDAGEDAFVFKLDIATRSLVYATLFGSSAEDELVGLDGRYSALQVDSAGDLYLAGYTVSTDFPVTPGPFESPGPQINIFVAKLNASESSLLFSSIFLGTSATYIGPMAVDDAGDVYIGGADGCGPLPASPGAFEPTIAEGLGFVAKFDAQTGARVFLTYLGDGNGTPFGRIAPPSDGSVWNDQSTNGPLAGHPLAVTPGRF
jgi:hypothetical protein